MINAYEEILVFKFHLEINSIQLDYTTINFAEKLKNEKLFRKKSSNFDVRLKMERRWYSCDNLVKDLLVVLFFLISTILQKIGPSRAHYYFRLNLSLIIESYLEYQYTV